MPPCIRDRRDGEAGFATALAMTTSLAIGLAATALLLRCQLDVINARHGLERVEAEYRLDAVQQLAARVFGAKADGIKLHRIVFEDTSASVTAEVEAAKLEPRAASKLADGWLEDLGVANPAALKARLAAWADDQPLSMQVLADLDPSPAWKACAASVISANGSPPGAARAYRDGRMTAAGSAGVLRLRAVGDEGWVDDRVVRLSGDAANPVVVLDRRFYRRGGEAPACPMAPDFGGLA